MSENDTDYMWPCFGFLFAFDQYLYFPIVLLLFRHLFLNSLSLCFLFYLLFETVFVNGPASSFSLLPFAFLPSIFGPYIFLFTPLPGDHGTRGPEHYTTTGPEDHRTRGPQDQSVLHSTTPVLLCTTKHYSSTNSVLQSTTPVLLCTTKYYSSTTLYYKVLLQYYCVLQSTTPVLLLELQSTHLQGAEHQRHQRHQMLRLPRKVTLMLILVAYETSFTMRGATGLPLQRHQVLCLPRKITLMSDVRHI